MRILVTGGAGFVGSAVIRHCLRHTPHHILNVDARAAMAGRDNLSAVLPHPRYDCASADIRDMREIERLFQMFDPDAVMHLAAKSPVGRSQDEACAFVDINVLGTFALLEAAKKHFTTMPRERKAIFRFHHVSTYEVYGVLGRAEKFTEVAASAPTSPYSASKASSAFLVRAWHHTYDLPVVTSNSSNNYGPYQAPDKLLPVVVRSALARKPIPIYGAGGNRRDWLFVEDHAEALLKVLENGRPGETYNIGGDNEIRNIDFVKSICALLDELKPDNDGSYQRLITHVEDRAGHDERHAVDAGKIAQELNWKPKTEFSDGLRQAVIWYLENEDWLQRQIKSG